MSFLGDASDALDRWHTDLAGRNPLVGFVALLPTFLVHILLILLVPVLIGLTYLAGVLAGLYLVGTLLYLVPTFLLVPALALRNIAHGALVVLSLPFRAVRELVFIASQPSAVRDIKRELARPQRTARDTARFVNDTLEAEADRALHTPRWRQPLSIFTSIRHYQSLAEYIDSLSRVAEATEEHVRRVKRSGNDKSS
jgi:hypothetical protein